MNAELHGRHLIAGERRAAGGDELRGFDPVAGEPLEPAFHEATDAEVDAAVEAAAATFDTYRRLGPYVRAAFLDAVGEEIEALGDALLERTEAETALPRPRLTGERGRTIGQLRMFAELVREGSWVEARIDRALPDRKPLPRPDLRRMLVPLGPVAVFGASNFPLAFSVAGGDTASALASGCPVVVKAHPAHPGASEMVGEAIVAAARRVGVPEGVFSLVQGAGHGVGARLVDHAAVRAVAFTGSLAGGRALFDRAARRPSPIPVYAEMGSSNPVFLLPGALAERGEAIAQGLAGSVTLGAGQFCTNPGLTVLPQGDEADRFVDRAAELLGACAAGTMVHPGISASFEKTLGEIESMAGVEIRARAGVGGPNPTTEARAALIVTDAATFEREERLGHEIYGPSTIAVTCSDRHQVLALARSLEGHLTATVHGTEADFDAWGDLVEVLEAKVGRLVFNGYPTGVEVSPAMQHGGPFPATTDSRTTSVGTAAILRFARPVCWQDAPASALPPELRDDNPRGVWRLVDGEPTREAI